MSQLNPQQKANHRTAARQADEAAATGSKFGAICPKCGSTARLEQDAHYCNDRSCGHSFWIPASHDDYERLPDHDVFIEVTCIARIRHEGRDPLDAAQRAANNVDCMEGQLVGELPDGYLGCSDWQIVVDAHEIEANTTIYAHEIRRLDAKT